MSFTMRFYSLSDNPNKPCAILQFKQVSTNGIYWKLALFFQVSLMLDCGLDLTPSLSFLPLSVVESSRPRGEPVDKQGLEGELRDCGGTVLVDSQPEVLPPQEGLFNFCDIDAILISNYTCMLALPYITETKGFRGKVIVKM